jgi:hypothetical protein
MMPVIDATDWNIPEDPDEFERWVQKQVAPMQRAARVFPIGTSPIVPIRVYIVGYSHDGEAVAILTDPRAMTEEALREEVKHALLLDPDQFQGGGPPVTHDVKVRH